MEIDTRHHLFNNRMIEPRRDKILDRYRPFHEYEAGMVLDIMSQQFVSINNGNGTLRKPYLN